MSNAGRDAIFYGLVTLLAILAFLFTWMGATHKPEPQAQPLYNKGACIKMKIDRTRGMVVIADSETLWVRFAGNKELVMVKVFEVEACPN